MKTVPRIESLTSSLCDEVDYWKAEAEYWKEQYESERKRYDELLSDNMLTAQRGVAQALMFALSVKDDENGNLVILKEDRKELAEQFK